MDRRRGTALFLCVEVALYVTFLAADFLHPHWGMDVPVKYLSIVLCLLFALTGLPHGYSRQVAAALTFTLLADAFLLVLNRHYLLGVLAFCVTQGLYALRIYGTGRISCWPGLGVRLVAALGGICLVATLGALEPLTGASAVYFSQLAVSGVESLRLGRGYRRLAVGLWLFICCDICVALRNLPQFFPQLVGSDGMELIGIGMWFFYLPSQVLITLSGERERERM